MEQLEEIIELVKKKMKEQGAYDLDAYGEFVDETIDYFLEKGKLTDDDNLELIKDTAMEMWESARDDLVEQE